MGNNEKEPLLLRTNFEGPSSSSITNEQISITRRVYLQEDLNLENQYDSTSVNLLNKVKKKVEEESAKQCFFNLIPGFKWMIRYNCRSNLIGDLLSGFTVAIMHIPQGMAYASLGNVPPIYGIYMAFFPVIIYAFLGTSRHVSMGTFAIVCLMTGVVVNQYSPDDTEDKIGPFYQNTHVAGTVSFTVGIIMLCMYVLRAGIIADLLSETLVNSFTCASAFHIITSQMKDLLGLTGIGRPSGAFKIVKNLQRIVYALPTANKGSLVISGIAVFVLLANSYFLKPWLRKKTKIPFPIELFVVVCGTAGSYFLDLPSTYNVTTVGDIPTGFPTVIVPIFEIVPDILYDCFIIALVSYTITMSMALMFSSKRHYQIQANQELFAIGASDIVGSFFQCMPITASLSRSIIQFDVGGVTQIASLVSCTILLFVLLWVGPIFETLPKAVLASIIMVALTSILMQAKEAKKFWHLSKWDFTVWICTFTATLLVAIDVGLCVGLILSLTSIFVRGYKPYTCLLGSVPGTDLYLDMKKYKSVKEVPGINIFRYCGGLNFASRTAFKSLLWKRIGFEAPKVYRKLQMGILPDTIKVSVKCIIIDLSALTFIDPQGVHTLSEIKEDLELLDIQMYIAACSVPVFEVLQKVNNYYKKENAFFLFPTIQDAVLYAQGTLHLGDVHNNIVNTILDKQ